MSALQPGFATFHENEAFSDCKVICGQYEFKVHKVILCSQSGFFMTALKSGTFKEGESGVIELKAKSNENDQADDCCDEPDVVKLMIEYFYHFDYLRPPASGPIDAPFLVEHAKVFAMAIKYQAEGLRKLAAQKFKDSAHQYWSSEEFAQAIRIVYHSTPEDVMEQRDAVADAIHDNFSTLHDQGDLKVVVASIASLAYGLLERSRKTCALVYAHDHGAGDLQHKCVGCGGLIKFCKTCHGHRAYGLIIFKGKCPLCDYLH